MTKSGRHYSVLQQNDNHINRKLDNSIHIQSHTTLHI